MERTALQSRPKAAITDRPLEAGDDKLNGLG
jgi:hypothetical protein